MKSLVSVSSSVRPLHRVCFITLCHQRHSSSRPSWNGALGRPSSTTLLASIPSGFVKRPCQQRKDSELSRLGSARPFHDGLRPTTRSGWIRLATLIAIVAGLGTTAYWKFAADGVAFPMLLSKRHSSDAQQEDSSDDPVDLFSPDKLCFQSSEHLRNKSMIELWRSYVTYVMCQIPGLAFYGPKVLNTYKSAADSVPLLGPVAWKLAEWLIAQTFFAHFAGGTTPHDCEPVLRALYDQNIGTVLNYSVEASENINPHQLHHSTSEVRQQHIDALTRAVETAANFESTENSKAVYPPNSIPMRPTLLALKLSGLTTDPYIFKRASDSLIAGGTSPYKIEEVLFPASAFTPDAPDPLSQSDRKVLQQLLTHLREVCAKAKANNVVVMIDAEYSWFQPALDRIATTLSAEFNNQSSSHQNQNQQSPPTVYNTFQALLRSTPHRLQEFIDEADRKGYSIGIKLVRGAYLVSETSHWEEEVLRENGKKSQPLPVWGSKEETDQCYDSIASNLVHRLSQAAKLSEQRSGTVGLDGKPVKQDVLGKSELSLMVAGHNVNSVAKILRQLKDHEGLAQVIISDGTAKLCVSDALRGRIMFSQLYSMADNLTSMISSRIVTQSSSFRESTDQSHKLQLQPFVHKYLPFGPVSEVIPYLARRAQENQSMLQNNKGRSTLTCERKAIGREIRRRLLLPSF